MISKKTIDEIVLTAKIEEVVGDFVSLKRQGKNWIGICPFHNDRTPSMHVNPQLGIFKCFVCDSGGDAVRFVMLHEKMSYPESLRYLAAKYNINIEEEREKTPEEIAEYNEKESLYIVNSFAENYFIDQLHNTPEGQSIALSYFEERGFKEATIKRFKLGYNPEGWDNFTQEALRNGYKLDHLLKTGLTKESENKKLYDFYRGRVIFPIHNTIGKTVGFGGRILKKDSKFAKYFNSPESDIYHKSDILYGFYFAKKAIRSKDNVYLVEGYTDVISMYESGIENVVASSGTALTNGQIHIISTQTKNITVLYDGDAAGIKASMRGIDLLLKAGLNVQVVLLPDGEDPDSFAKKHRDTELADFLTQNATNFLIFKAKILSKEAGNDPIKRSQMVNEMIQSISDVPDDIAKAFYIKECSELFKLPEEVLNTQLRKITWKKINKQEPITIQLPKNEITTPSNNTTYTNPDQNLVELIEAKIIELIIKYGIYEVDIEEIDANGERTICKSRLDQYIFNDFSEDKLLFHNPLYQKIYDEYAEVASKTLNQVEIMKHFTTSNDPMIQKFVFPFLLTEDPSFSPEWERRFDMITHSINTNIHKLNKEVENTINMYKFRLIEGYLEQLRKELTFHHSEEESYKISEKYTLCLSRRSELAKLLGMVVSK